MIVGSERKIMEYWLYFDDSGKFLNKKDNHVLFGGILFKNKNKRNNFIQKYKTAKSKITNKSEFKGNDFATKYKKHKRSPYKKANLENLIKQYELVDEVICVFACKKDLKEPAYDEEHAKLKRNFMIALLLKKLIETKKILPNSIIRIYLDKMDSEAIQETDAKRLKEYLNKNYSANKIIRFLRAKNIHIQRVQHLDSETSDCIQAADIISNFSNKYLNRHPQANELLGLFKNFKIKVFACKFPNIEYNEDVQSLECCWSESSR